MAFMIEKIFNIITINHFSAGDMRVKYPLFSQHQYFPVQKECGMPYRHIVKNIHIFILKHMICISDIVSKF